MEGAGGGGRHLKISLETSIGPKLEAQPSLRRGRVLSTKQLVPSDGKRSPVTGLCLARTER